MNTKFYNTCFIMGSDDDQPMIMELYAGFNFRNELTISINFTDYEDPRYNCSTYAIVNTEDARTMAHRHNVRFCNLPLFIAECMEDWGKIVNPTLSQVKDCFKEITECLLDEGCRFRIERTHGPNGYICC